MDSNSYKRGLVPFRHRHDGWTTERQGRFLERLTGTGCVAEASRAAGLSTTSAYRAYHRMPDFAAEWDQALMAQRPMLEDAAFQRAVSGIAVPLTRLGKVIGKRRQYSDSLLRFLIERGDRLEKGGAAAPRYYKPEPPIEEVRAEILRRIEAMGDAEKKRLQAEQLAWADRMIAEGKCP